MTGLAAHWNRRARLARLAGVVGVALTITCLPTSASGATGSNSGSVRQPAAEQKAADARAPSSAGFHAFDRPVAAYTDNSCPKDFSTVADGAGVVTLFSREDCTPRVDFDDSMTKYSVPDGGWLSWGSPPDTEGNTPDVLFSDTGVRLNYSHQQKVGGFELQPDLFKGRHRFTVEFYEDTFGEGELRGTIVRKVNGRAGAKLFGARVDDKFESIVITDNDGVGFAIAQVRA